ncbi:MAG: hypothetical protein OEV42_08320 [Deltaproteobacteria bacterium]|nr:hypothetical protein [Deltaproteobacteria bacterium]
MCIKLNFINQSNDSNNSEVVIFQKNANTDFDELAVAWTVIKNCGIGDHHPFVYPHKMTIAASDSYGNYTPQLNAEPGQLFHVALQPSGNELSYVGPGSSPKEVQLRNDLQKGAINAYIYKDGKVLAQKTGIAPAQMAVFEFKPTLWIGVASEVEEGQTMNSAIISNINTELNLLGISSADIVMRGGGAGSSATPFTFTLENVTMAQRAQQA